MKNLDLGVQPKTVEFLLGEFLDGPVKTGEISYFQGMTQFAAAAIESVFVGDGCELLRMSVGGKDRALGDRLERGQEIRLDVKQASSKSPSPAIFLAIREDAEGVVPEGVHIVSAVGLRPVKPMAQYLVRAGGSVEIFSTFPYLFRPVTIDIETDAEGDLFVEDIQIGNRYAYVSDPIPVEAFKKRRIEFATCAVGMRLTVRLLSRATVPRFAKVRITGLALR